jgi:hypothetical protein
MFAQNAWVRLIGMPDKVYQVAAISDSSHIDFNHRVYDPPYFYQLRKPDGTIAHWPHSCLEPAEAPIVQEIDHSPEGADYWAEWRQADDGRWFKTGTAGINLSQISHPDRILRRPNTRLFAHGFDPNSDPSLEPEIVAAKAAPKQAIQSTTPSVHRAAQQARIDYAEQALLGLAKSPNAEAAIAVVQAMLDDAQRQLSGLPGINAVAMPGKS